MTAPTSSLNYLNWNVSRGTPWRTGFTFNAGTGTTTISTASNELKFIKSIEFVVQSGAGWSNLTWAFPAGNGDVDGTKNLNISSTVATGTIMLAMVADKIVQYGGDVRNEQYDPASGTVFYGYQINLDTAIQLRNDESDTFTITFTSLDSRVDLRLRGWTINESNKGF